MDRKEAIEWLKDIKESEVLTDWSYDVALDLAIKALEREIEYGQMVVDLTKGEALKSGDWEYTNTPTDTPTNDCISRQQAIEEIALHDCTNGEVPYFTGKGVQEILKTLPPVVSTFNKDCIGRQDVMEALDRIGSLDTEADREYAKGIFDSIPPVTPTERTGEWVDVSGSWCANEECSLCGEIVHEYNYNYCPNCGAKME